MNPLRRTHDLRRFALSLAIATVIGGCGDSGDSPAEDSGVADSSDTQTDATDGSGGGLEAGAACTAATECSGRLACVRANRQAATPTCEDLTIGWTDDGSEPELRRNGKWLRKRITDWDALQTVCNDGSPYAYAISPGTGQGRQKWLLFFKGGDFCQNETTCGIRWAAQRQVMRQLAAARSPSPTEGPDAGLFARDQATNHFKDWNFVYFHYCSSDNFAGSRLAAEHPARLNFRGRAIVEATVAELLNGVDISAVSPTPETPLPPMSEATHVVVSGGSAGARGARNVMDWIASEIHARNPNTVTVGVADSVVHPVVRREQFPEERPGLEWFGMVLDADCVEAHPDAPGLCTEDMHLITGGGTADYLGLSDQGHLGVAGSQEGAAVSGVFTFMAQYDQLTLTPIGKFGWCARAECTTDADCAAGQGCVGQRCYTAAPCAPPACTPDDLPCMGIDGPAACLGEVATHVNECDDTADCAAGGVGCCEDGEECQLGVCIQSDYLGCGDDSDCPTGTTCRGRVCSRGADGPNDCTEPGFVFVEDTATCNQVIGCTADTPCGAGYTCIPGELNPVGQALSYGLRTQLSALSPTAAPRHGIYISDSSTHTAINGKKYYGMALPRILGNTFAEVLSAWLTPGAPYVHHVGLAAVVPLRLWAYEVQSLEAVGVSARTAGTGCADDALLFGICSEGESCTAAADFAASASIGDTGTTTKAGATLSSPDRLRLVIAANPACTSPSLSPEPRAFLTMTYRYGAAQNQGHTLKIALPTAALGTTIPLPATWYIGADGSTWRDPAMTELVAGRVE